MFSDFENRGGFFSDWAEAHAQDRESMSWRRLAAEYRCTYLTGRTLAGIQRILDAGCGAGFLVKYLAGSNRAVSYVGTDRSIASLAIARGRFQARPFLCSDVKTLPFRINAFDLAYSRDVLIHHSAPYEAMRELYRVARYVLLHIRTAEIDDLFTAEYRHADVLHQFFPLGAVLDFARNLVPAPRLIRCKVDKWHPRAFDTTRFRSRGNFSRYFVADVFIAKGPARDSSVRVIDDTNYTTFQRVLRKLYRRSYLPDGF